MSMLKQFRLKKELSQEEMAKKLKLSVNGYRNYESGKRMIPIDVLIRFLKLRNCPSNEKLVEVLESICENQDK